MSNDHKDEVPSPPRPLAIDRMVLIASAVLALDQITKAAVVHLWAPGTRGPVVIPGFFSLVHFRNRGGAWGILGDFPLGLVLFSFLALAFIAVRLRSLIEDSAWRAVCIALVTGGILGNLVDRLARGEVVDFLLFRLGRYSWPAFNVSDSAICVGVFGFLIATFIEQSHDQQ